MAYGLLIGTESGDLEPSNGRYFVLF